MAQSTSMKKPLVTFAGNHLGDDVRIANVFDFESNPVISGVTYLVAASSDPGVLTAPVGWMNFVPQVEPGGVNASLVTQQTFNAGQNLPIRGLPSGNPAPGYYLRFVQSRPMIQLDCPRSLFLGVIASGGSPTNAFIFYASGADLYGQLMTVTHSVAAGGVATAYYDLDKSFAYLADMKISAAPGCPIWVGVGPTYGIEYYTPEAGHLTRVTSLGTSLNINTGGVFNAPPALNAVPSPTGNDVRGSITTFTPTEWAAETVPERLTIQYIIEGGTAQSGWNYNAELNIWTVAPQGSGSINGVFYAGRVLSILGAPQYYDPTLF